MNSRLAVLEIHIKGKTALNLSFKDCMIAGDIFVYTLMLLNLGAALSYAAQGLYVKALYWSAVLVLNGCLVKMQ